MRNKLEWRLAVALCALLLVGSAVLLAGCGGTEAAPTEPAETDAAPEPAASPTTAPADTAAPETEEAPAETAAPPVTPGVPAEALASSGEEVYAAECAECHGELGEGLIGPALIGDRAGLGKYGTAEGLYNYVHTTMPQNAPGSLTEQQYLEVVTFLLVQNGTVQGNTEISEEGLSDIPLE